MGKENGHELNQGEPFADQERLTKTQIELMPIAEGKDLAEESFESKISKMTQGERDSLLDQECQRILEEFDKVVDDFEPEARALQARIDGYEAEQRKPEEERDGDLLKKLWATARQVGSPGCFLGRLCKYYDLKHKNDSERSLEARYEIIYQIASRIFNVQEILDKAYDFVYVAPRSAILPMMRTKNILRWLRKLSGDYQKYKGPYFFFPRNKAYRSLLNFFKLVDLYPSSRDVPEDEKQVRSDLGLPTEGKIYEHYQTNDQLVQPEKARGAYQLVEDVQRKIRKFFQDNPESPQVKFLVYDESYYTGETRRGMGRIIESAAAKLGEEYERKVEVDLSDDDTRTNTMPGEWPRLLTDSELGINRAHKSDIYKYNYDKFVLKLIDLLSEHDAIYMLMAKHSDTNKHPQKIPPSAAFWGGYWWRDRS